MVVRCSDGAWSLPWSRSVPSSECLRKGMDPFRSFVSITTDITVGRSNTKAGNETTKRGDGRFCNKGWNSEAPGRRGHLRSYCGVRYVTISCEKRAQEFFFFLKKKK